MAAQGTRFRTLCEAIANDYAQADLLLRLPGFTPMPAFRRVEDVPLVVRMARTPRDAVRARFDIAPTAKVVVYNFGGQSPTWALRESFLPKGWVGIGAYRRCVHHQATLLASRRACCSALVSHNHRHRTVVTGMPRAAHAVAALVVVVTALDMPELPPNFIKPPTDSYTPDLIDAADVILGKVGYGTTSEAIAHHKPFVYVRRDFFNEQPFLGACAAAAAALCPVRRSQHTVPTHLTQHTVPTHCAA